MSIDLPPIETKSLLERDRVETRIHVTLPKPPAVTFADLNFDFRNDAVKDDRFKETASYEGRTLSSEELIRRIYDRRPADPRFTPESLMLQFRDFQFSFGAEVQTPEEFILNRKGDCDDFATLAAKVLAADGYDTTLLAVRMKGETHVVCYVREARGYLDYNKRSHDDPVTRCSPALRRIADSVAESFDRPWIVCYPFTFQDGVKRLTDVGFITNSVRKMKAVPAGKGSELLRR